MAHILMFQQAHGAATATVIIATTCAKAVVAAAVDVHYKYTSLWTRYFQLNATIHPIGCHDAPRHTGPNGCIIKVDDRVWLSPSMHCSIHILPCNTA